MAFLLERERKT